jgi:hypothetical protein
MFRAEILWLANGPTLKMQGRLVGEWAEQARCLVTTEVVPKGLIVDMTEVSYVDSAGESLLSWLGSLGAVFVASGVYAPAVCERLGLSLVRRMPAQRPGNNEGSPRLRIPMQADAGPGRHQEEEGK